MSIFSHPIKKLTIVGIFAGAYVLGAKAGRERYEQIRRTANQVKDDPHVKEAAARAQDLLRDATATVSGVVSSDSPSDSTTGTRTNGDVHPLLADEHTPVDEEVVYSSGPDIEETVDELRPTNDADRL